MDISLFASAIRPHLWEKLFESLKSNKCKYEIVLSGYIDNVLIKEIIEKYPEMKYITTGDIKPAQCYEIARRNCTGKLIGWISDDCEFPEGALDKIWELYNSHPEKQDCMKLVPFEDMFKTFREYILFAINTFDPECSNNNLNDQRFFSRNLNTPQMAIIGFMNREYLDKIGGLDRRYIYGKFESDICMRVLADGGKVIPFNDITIKISHTSKNGELNNDWSGVNEDGETLENSWVVGGYKDFEKPLIVMNDNRIQLYHPISNREVTLKRFDKFEPYEEPISLIQSQGLNTRWQ